MARAVPGALLLLDIGRARLTAIWTYSLRRPRLTVAGSMALLLLTAPGLVRLRVRTDGNALVPQHAPEVQHDRAIRAAFAVRDPVVLLVCSTHPAGIFNAQTLVLVERLSDALRSLEGIASQDVFSLATEYGHRVRPGTLTFRRFLEPLPTTEAEVNQLRDDLRAIRLYSGTLVSKDERCTAVMVGVPGDGNRIDWLKRIDALLPPAGTIPETIRLLGAPVAESLLGTHLLEDLGIPGDWLGYSTREAPADEIPGRGLAETLRRIVGSVGLLPVALVVLALVFYACFRRVAAVAIPLWEMGACLVFVFGLMGWFGVPIYLTTAVMPIILIAAGVADEVHIFTRYAALARAQGREPEADALRQTMTELAGPIVKTSLTTAVGFLAFALSPLAPVRAFGVLTAVGVLFCMVWSLTVIPAQLAMVRPRWLVRSDVHTRQSQEAGRPAILPRLVLRGRAIFLWAGAALALAAAPGVRSLVVQDSWIDGFAPDSAFRRATAEFNAQFLGSHLLLVAVEGALEHRTGEVSVESLAGQTVRIPLSDVDPTALVGWKLRIKRAAGTPPASAAPVVREEWEGWIEHSVREGGDTLLTVSRSAGPPRALLQLDQSDRVQYELTRQPLNSPDIVRQIAALEKHIRGLDRFAVGGALGAPDYLETTHLMSRGLDEDFRRVPDDPERIEWLWSQYGRIRGELRLRQLVSADFTRTLVSVFLKNANFVDTAALMGNLREYEQKHLAPHGLALSFAGDVAVSQTLIDSIVATQVESLILSQIGVLAVTALLHRSLVWGLVCLLPCALAVLVNFAVMGFAGVPLGVATSMFSAMVIGIGVDFAIHLVERYRQARRAGRAVDEALVDAMQVTGAAITRNAAAVGLGIGVMMLSQVPANARLGGLLVLSMVTCLCATLTLLPALVAVACDRRPRPSCRPASDPADCR